MPEDELRHVDLLFGVHLARDALAVVPDLDGAFACVDCHLDLGAALVTLDVVGGIYENLVEDLVEAGHDGDFLADHLGLALVKYPHRLLLHLCGADIGVWPQQDVLTLGFLLIGCFNTLFHSEQLITANI